MDGTVTIMGSCGSSSCEKNAPLYADGVYMMSGGSRPSPRNLSQAFMRGADGLGSLKNRTALQTFFGQVGKILNIMAIYVGSVVRSWSAGYFMIGAETG